MQAGRELRVFVEPTALDDAAAILLARRLAKRIEEKRNYAGQVKVTVIRVEEGVVAPALASKPNHSHVSALDRAFPFR